MKEAIAILTGGGPAPGMNTVVGSVAKTFLAKGYSLEDATKEAKDYVTGAIENALELGKGCGPTNHFYALWNKD